MKATNALLMTLLSLMMLLAATSATAAIDDYSAVDDYTAVEPASRALQYRIPAEGRATCQVTIVNPSDEALPVDVIAYGEDAREQTIPITLAVRERRVLDISAMLAADLSAAYAVLEIAAGREVRVRVHTTDPNGERRELRPGDHILEDDGSAWLPSLSEAATMAVNPPEATDGFGWPLPYTFTNNGGNSFLTYDKVSYRLPVYHPGEDWNVPSSGSCNGDRGLKVEAAAAGTVVYANGNSWGGIVVKHLYKGSVWYTQYGHVQKLSVQVSDNVRKGQQIAEIGNKETTCAHLHFSVIKTAHPRPEYGAYWSYGSTGLGNRDNVLRWYENPAPFIQSHPAYDTAKLDVTDFRRTGDPFYANPNATRTNPNFSASYVVRNGGNAAVTIEQLSLAVHSGSGAYLWDMIDRSGFVRSYSNVRLQPGQTFSFATSYAWFVVPGSFRIVAKARIGGSWRDLQTVTVNVLASPSSSIAAPSSLVASASGPTSARVTWRDNSTNEARFELERASGSGAWAVIAAVGANSVSYIDHVSQGVTYRYRVRAATTSGMYSAYSNIASLTIASAPVTLLNEGAESGAPGWTISTSSGSGWYKQSSVYSHSGSWRFVVGGGSYSGNTNAALVSPSFSMSGRSAGTLTFWYKHQIESNWDYFSVEASKDGGSSWTTLVRRTGTSPSWDQWAQTSVDLGTCAGASNCRVRFRFTSDSSVSGWGVIVDDVVVTVR